ncbi:CAP domain-containing protein [Arthrobacter silvisoli]|uniref:CAP domain-containing protein n=1 Tax=Arthrobacter silvisoli TaxID=2291022 RepID=UPI001FE5F20D|nr:CAP domain-containing protein [Arthrobacter silvisoli]
MNRIAAAGAALLACLIATTVLAGSSPAGFLQGPTTAATATSSPSPSEGADSAAPLDPAAPSGSAATAEPSATSAATPSATPAPGASSSPSPTPTSPAAPPVPGQPAPTSPAGTPPEVPSIPPLWGPDPLPAAKTTAPKAAAPRDSAAKTASEAGPTEAFTAVRASEVTRLAPQALVKDDNSAAVLAVFNAINSYRASLKLNPVKYHPTVASLSQDWSDNIATREVIEHRANFWLDPRALNPDRGAGEVIAVRWDRDAAKLVDWWKSSPAHDAMLRDPRFNVIGVGITFTDGNWQTTPNRYTMWGVVNLFGYSTLPAGTVNSPGAAVTPPTPPATDVCTPLVKQQPPTWDLTNAAIRGPGDLVSVDPYGNLRDYPALGNGSFGPVRAVGKGFTGAKELFVTDWDRDGVFDVLAQQLDGRLLLYPGLLDGGFAAPVQLGGSGWQTMTVAVGTWCGNNRMPQILATNSKGQLYLYQNRGLAAVGIASSLGVTVPGLRLAMVDYDADGLQDLLAVESTGNLRLYRGSGAPAPKTETRPVVGTGWTDYSGLRSLRNVTGLNTTGIAGLTADGKIEYWDLSSGKFAGVTTVASGWGGVKLAQ